jgi:hypothetical protein
VPGPYYDEVIQALPDRGVPEGRAELRSLPALKSQARGRPSWMTQAHMGALSQLLIPSFALTGSDLAVLRLTTLAWSALGLLVCVASARRAFGSGSRAPRGCYSPAIRAFSSSAARLGLVLARLPAALLEPAARDAWWESGGCAMRFSRGFLRPRRHQQDRLRLFPAAAALALARARPRAAGTRGTGAAPSRRRDRDRGPGRLPRRGIASGARAGGRAARRAGGLRRSGRRSKASSTAPTSCA